MGQAAYVLKAPRLTIEQKSFVQLHIPKKPRALKDRQPCKEIAGVRIREFLFDVGRELEHEHGWKAHAARRAGLNYSTAWGIIQGLQLNIGPDVVDQVSLATGCPVSVFYDVEVR